MKNEKVFMAIVLMLVVFIGAISFNYKSEVETVNKPDIKELITLRNNYQIEYERISTEIECEEVIFKINYTLGINDTIDIDFDKIYRQQTLKDSIEILNVMINNYQF